RAFVECTQPVRISTHAPSANHDLFMAGILLVTVVVARLAGSGRRSGRTEDQTLRFRLQFADQLFQQARSARQAGAERLDVGRGLLVELAAQMSDRVFDLPRLV